MKGFLFKCKRKNKLGNISAVKRSNIIKNSFKRLNIKYILKNPPHSPKIVNKFRIHECGMNYKQTLLKKNSFLLYINLESFFSAGFLFYLFFSYLLLF